MDRIWLDHYPENVPADIDVPNLSLYDFLKRTAEDYGSILAVIDGKIIYTYDELKEEVDRFATALHDLGVQKGDRVAVMLPNCVEYIISHFAVQRIGGIVVQVNPMYQEAELAHIFRQTEPKVTIGEANQQEKLAAVQSLKVVVFTDRGSLSSSFAENEYHFHDLLDQGDPASAPEISIDPKKDPALIQFTGGTTGTPKGAVLTHYNLVGNVLQTFAFTSNTLQRPGEVFLGAAPFYHVMAMSSVINQGVFAAATIICMRKWTVEEAVEIIERYRPTYFPAVPTMYIGLLRYAEKNPIALDSIKIMTSGSAPLPVEVLHKVEQMTSGVISEGYGLSETSPTTHRNPFRGKRKSGSIGLPLPGTDCEIVDLDTHEPVSIGQAGELWVKGPQVMLGYWNEQEETDAQLQNGWFATGDIAEMDEEGYFYIVGRKKEMVISSGFNIYPGEVEEMMYQHPGVRELVVYGVPDPYRGETLKASVVAKEGETLTEEDLTSWCKKRMASYKVPKIFDFRMSLPKTSVGKILRRQLVQETVDEMEKEGSQ
ncbi:long-chain fatty acid--CoA ligase [Salicibibacter halophilus]|uniref:Long-chain fatty acid--CoA ligase n=1 Tax=Salicibibacter halophilus TaxID=2502791 RepID=A0A514LEN6_9BACI|nr:long-chain fatty acid--CoA ligase [Salicibibacter halophilus]QDI90314.1 long-chain fatty acid--CoA ligase [Salicibibacter halophilus]